MKKKVTIQLEDYILEKAQRRAEQLGVSLSSYFSILAAQNIEQTENSFWARNGMRPYCAGESINTVNKPNSASGSGRPPAVPPVTADSASHVFVSFDDTRTEAKEARVDGVGPLGASVSYFG